MAQYYHRGSSRKPETGPDLAKPPVQDIEKLGLKPDQRVTVRSAAGAMSGILLRGYDIRAGNALMYFPEANVLVPTTTDPLSKTPAFKCLLITIEPEVLSKPPDGSQAAQADGARGRVRLNLVQK